ncbi:Phosphatidylinositol 4-kinase alpha [Datura stramonium]|uniref:Phosphatidylinositol 4-kinase alpha n=1 Tax=Datura stramonium TaxID=4076 RepID=A0ABS8V7G1_DATST|nr:Phosphatidylinositol 4-kinase alpha [Datura stramonium]
MESLMELCDLIAQKPVQLAEKLVWICRNCPPAETLRVSRSQLSNVLAVARFLSKCPNHTDELSRSVVLDFYRSIPLSFNLPFWPQGFTNDSIGSFYGDFFGYICKACELSPGFFADVARFTGDIMISAIGNGNEDLGISKVVLKAMCCHFPPVVCSDGNKLVSGLIEQFEMLVNSYPRGLGTLSSSSPMSKLVEGYLLRATQRSDIFAHILIWNLQGETCELKHSSSKHAAFLALLPLVRQWIIDRFNEKARDVFQREFDFFDKVTSISDALYPLPKEERRAGIRRELEKIKMQGDDLYLPTAPNKILKGIQVDSGIPLQSAAKVPIMITFNVTDRDGDQDDIRPQACIFKVGDDCRQDVLALQVISLLKDIFEAVGLNLYLYPYGVLPTGPERGIIEVVPNSRSRSQMGETTDGGLYEIFQQDFGPVGSPGFEAARENFIITSAGYAVASMLLQPKDRHNGNLLIDSAGRLVHVDFGFILGISPGRNMRFESTHFKLSHEMTQLIDPSGAMKSETWHQFVSFCVKGYLAARHYMDGIIVTVSMMQDSGLPFFNRGDPVGNLRKRFHPEMSEREAANYMIHACRDTYNKWTTAGYDLIQYMQQGIEK